MLSLSVVYQEANQSVSKNEKPHKVKELQINGLVLMQFKQLQGKYDFYV